MSRPGPYEPSGGGTWSEYSIGEVEAAQREGRPPKKDLLPDWYGTRIEAAPRYEVLIWVDPPAKPNSQKEPNHDSGNAQEDQCQPPANRRTDA